MRVFVLAVKNINIFLYTIVFMYNNYTVCVLTFAIDT